MRGDLGVHAVVQLVEEQRRRVAEQRGGDAEPLPHAEGLPADLAAGGGLQSGQRDHHIDPAGLQSLGVGEPQQLVARAAAGLQCPGVQQRADMAQRVRRGAVRLAGDGGGACAGGVQADDDTHGGRLAGAVRPDEAGPLAGTDRERHLVQRLRRAEPLAQSVNLDSRVHGCPQQAGPAWGSG